MLSPEQLFGRISDAVLAVDVETQRIVLWNPAASRIFGYQAEEALRLRIEALVPPEARQSLSARLARYCETGRGQMIEAGAPVEMTALHKTGDVLRAEFTVSPVEPSDNTPSRTITQQASERMLLVLVRDVTDHRLREEELAHREATERRRAEQAERLSATLASVGAAVDLEEALQGLVRGAVSLLDGDEGVAQVFATADGQPRLMVRVDRAGVLQARETTEALVPGSFSQQICDGGPAVLVEDYATLDPARYTLSSKLAQRGMRASVNVPINAAGKRIGSLHVNHRQPGYFGEPDLSLAEVLAAQTGTVIQRVRLEEQLRRSQEALLDQQRFLQAVLDQVQAGIVACDAEGRLTLFNRAAREFHGLSAAPLPPERWAEYYGLYAADGKTPMRKEDIPLYRAVNGNVVEDVEMVIAPKQRPARTLTANGQAIIGSEGQQLGAVVAMHDITARKRTEQALRQAKEFAEQLIDSSVDGILAFDRECRYTIWNPGMERITGIHRSQTIGRRAFDVFPFLEEIGEDQCFFAALAGRTVEVKDRPYVVSETGTQGYFEGCYAPIRDAAGGVIGGLAVIRDITERRQLEAQRERDTRLEGALLAARTTAHLVNNQLTKTVGLCEWLAGNPDLPTHLRPKAIRALAGARQGALTIQQLMFLARLEEIDHGPGIGTTLDLDRSTGEGSRVRAEQGTASNGAPGNAPATRT